MLPRTSREGVSRVIARESVPGHAPNTLMQRVRGQIVLLQIEGGQYYALDDTGVSVWELCDGTRSVADIAAHLALEYDAPAETIEADVCELLQELAEEKLITVSAGHADPPA
jgi:coenzyme PQQ biosynthesis protein PqqD